ncbi:hypothetical protein [Halotalea alkalilenta]|uniref:hypothetical protein n=1 Tax=Halotalea alkalilenta TaxID=376489 RepID=UPI000486A025|nr:hypothetical protein [Halotalea alkalilenta]
MESQSVHYAGGPREAGRGRQVGEFIFTVVLWLVIGILVQWLMPASATLPLDAAAGVVGGSFWSALGLVALFFTVLAFMLRDLAATNPLAKALRLIATRVLATTFDIGLFGFGGYLFYVLRDAFSSSVLPIEHATLWQQLFIGSLPLFVIILVVLGALLFILRCTGLSLLSIPRLEYRPLWRVGIYLLLCVLLALVAWLAM